MCWIRLSIVWWGLWLAAMPVYAQTTTSSTPTAAERVLLDRLLHPRRFEGYLQQNRTFDGKTPIKPVDQLTIPNVEIKNIDLKNLVKRGGVDSGGGDQLGLDFQNSLAGAQLDYKQYSYQDNDSFLWSDLAEYGSTLTVIAVDQPLMENGRPSFRVAQNNVVHKTVLIQRSIWNRISDQRIKNAVALNQVLLMRENKSSGYSSRALLTLRGEGLSGLALFNGESSALTVKELSETREHQCLWSFTNLQRVSKVAESEIYLCTYEKMPLRFAVRAAQVNSLLSRCESLCSLQPDLIGVARKCRDYRQQYELLRSTAKRVRPACVPEER